MQVIFACSRFPKIVFSEERGREAWRRRENVFSALNQLQLHHGGPAQGIGAVHISKLIFMTYAGLSSPACMAAVLACSSVLPRTTLFGEKSYGDTWGSQTWTTCIVPIVFSRLLFKSPPDLKGVYIFQFVMIHFFWITLPTRLWLRRWTSLQCQQRQQGTWGSAPTDKQVIS